VQTFDRRRPEAFRPAQRQGHDAGAAAAAVPPSSAVPVDATPVEPRAISADRRLIPAVVS